MEILPLACYENLKRYLRRRKYQRLNSSTHSRKKLKISRLGGVKISTTTRSVRKIRRTPKMLFRIIATPIKLLVKFHDAYVDMMISVAKKAANPNKNGGLFGGRRVAESRDVALVSPGEEVVGSRLVMEIMYKKLAASRQLSSELL